MPSLPKEAIAIDVVYPAIVLLAHSRSLKLLPTMICSLLNDLRELHSKFNKVETFINNEGETIYKTLNPRVELPLNISNGLVCASLSESHDDPDF